MTRHRALAALAAASALLLVGCAPAGGSEGGAASGTAELPVVESPSPKATPEQEFAARQLATAGLTVEDLGAGWSLLPGEDGSGGGPGDGDRRDPCIWNTAWVPDPADIANSSWRMYSADDEVTRASDWIAAAAPGVDLSATLEEFRETLSACGSTEWNDGETAGTIVITPDADRDLGDASFSYTVDFVQIDGLSAGVGEVHTFVCGPLWVHLSYMGFDPFVERDALLDTLAQRSAALGGCNS